MRVGSWVKNLAAVGFILWVLGFSLVSFVHQSTRGSQLESENQKLNEMLKANSELLLKQVSMNEELYKQLQEHKMHKEQENIEHADELKRLKRELGLEKQNRLQAQESNPVQVTENIQTTQKTIKTAPGEMGKPVYINEAELSPQEKEKYQKGWKDNSFNQYASDMISLERTLPDMRGQECKNFSWYSPLPSVSVIIIFYNEAWSVLLRTVYSVINRSDASLLKEVILIDDASTFSMFYQDKFILLYTNIRLYNDKKVT
jgi:hypothetical protein